MHISARTRVQHGPHGRYVFHLIIRSPNPAQLAAWLRDLPAPKGARLRLDPDPVGFVGLLGD